MSDSGEGKKADARKDATRALVKSPALFWLPRVSAESGHAAQDTARVSRVATAATHQRTEGSGEEKDIRCAVLGWFKRNAPVRPLEIGRAHV